MLKMRTASLPPDLQYVLDGGVEYGHLSGGAHAALSLYGEIAVIDAIGNDPRPGERGWLATSAMALDLEGYGQDLIRQMEPALASACRGSTTVSFIKALADYGEFICGAAYEDAIWGGSMRSRHRTMADARGRIHRRLARAMESDEWVKRNVARHHREAGFRHLLRQWHLIGPELPPVSRDGFELLDITFREQKARRAERDRAYWESHTPAGKIASLARRDRKKKRRVVVKAAAVAASILGATAVSAFARGEPVELRTPDLTVKLVCARSVFEIGHGALNVSLVAPDGRFLSNMCIYQEKLPVLDQLASMALFVQAGEIDKVISTGNLYNFAPDAFAHPMLAEKKKAIEPRAELAEREDGLGMMIFGIRGGDIDGYETRRVMMREHEERRGDAFRHRTFIAVLGAREAKVGWRLFEDFRERFVTPY